MADITFVDTVTVLPASWANDINDFYYTLFGATGGLACIGDNANANMTIGLTVNQGAADNELFAGKSSDVAHGITNETETDTYVMLKKYAATTGGAIFWGFSEDAVGLSLAGVVTNAVTTKSAAGYGAMRLSGYLKSGTAADVLSANANILSVDTAGTTRFILDSDGDSHQDVGTAWTNFHGHDDHELLSALSANVSRMDDPIRDQFRDFIGKKRDALERAKLVTFNEDGHHFVNMSKLTMLHTGAILQAGDRLTQLEQKMKLLHG